MVASLSRSNLPSVSRKEPASPVSVLFKRRVSPVGVAAQGIGELSRSSLRCGGGDIKDQRNPVHSVLRQLRSVGSSVGAVASRLAVASASQSVASAFVPVASASQSVPRQSARLGSPLSVLLLTLRGLGRRAAAAKVLRGRRRLERSSERDQLREVVSKVASRVDQKSGVSLRACVFASQSVASELQASRSPGRASRFVQ